MKVLIINCSQRKEKSITYNLAKIQANLLNVAKKDIDTINLPKDFPKYCYGCSNCILGNASKCPNFELINPLKEKIYSADVLIFAVPVFVFGIPGYTKSFLDHFAHQWIVHRPNEKMFSKQAIIITSSAGSTNKYAIQTMKQNLTFWGISKIYYLGIKSYCYDWKDFKKEYTISKKLEKISKKVKLNSNKNIKPNTKIKNWFFIIRMLHNKKVFSEADSEYWKNKGWLQKERPWK